MTIAMKNFQDISSNTTTVREPVDYAHRRREYYLQSLTPTQRIRFQHLRSIYITQGRDHSSFYKELVSKGEFKSIEEAGLAVGKLIQYF